jgi:hypothetical protein
MSAADRANTTGGEKDESHASQPCKKFHFHMGDSANEIAPRVKRDFHHNGRFSRKILKLLTSHGYQ